MLHKYYVKSNVALLLLIKLLMKILNQLIVFATSYCVREIVIKLLYIICKQYGTRAFSFLNQLDLFPLNLAFNWTSRIQMSVNNLIYTIIFMHENKFSILNRVQVPLKTTFKTPICMYM